MISHNISTITPTITFTRAPRARSARTTYPPTLRDPSLRKDDENPSRVDDPGDDDSIHTVKKNSRRTSTSTTYRPVLFSLGTFDLVSLLLCCLFCFPFFHALGGYGVASDKTVALSGNSSNTNSSVGGHAANSLRSITNSVNDSGTSSAFSPILETPSAGNPKLLFKAKKPSLVPVSLTQYRLEEPLVYIAPSGAPNVDYLFDYASPGDSFALRVHSPRELAMQHEMWNTGWGHGRGRQRG